MGTVHNLSQVGPFKTPAKELTLADEAEVTENVSSALAWAAKHMRPGIEYLRLSITGPQGAACYQTLSRELPSLTSLAKLRCIEMDFGGKRSQHGDLSLFSRLAPNVQLEWVLQHAASLEALSLAGFGKPIVIAFAGMARHFQHLKHLELPGALKRTTSEPALQLPALETLHVAGDMHDKIDVSGCMRLRLLVVEGAVYQVVKRLSCQLGIIVSFDTHRNPGFDILTAEGMRNHLAVINELVLCIDEDNPPRGAENGIFDAMPNLEVLMLAWPEYPGPEADEDQQPHVVDPMDEAEGILIRCMPKDRVPVWKLRVICVEALHIKGITPRALPNLRELVVYARGRLELSFEDPASTGKTLETFYAFGYCRQPLLPDEGTTREMQHSVAQRSMTMVEASMQRDCASPHSVYCSCTSLRPAAAPDLSMEELRMTIHVACLCRCGACFMCLRRAGYIK